MNLAYLMVFGQLLTAFHPCLFLHLVLGVCVCGRGSGMGQGATHLICGLPRVGGASSYALLAPLPPPTHQNQRKAGPRYLPGLFSLRTVLGSRGQCGRSVGARGVGSTDNPRPSSLPILPSPHPASPPPRSPPPALPLPLLSRPVLPSRLQFQRSCRNWNWHSSRLRWAASCRVSARPGSRRQSCFCRRDSFSRSHCFRWAPPCAGAAAVPSPGKGVRTSRPVRLERAREGRPVTLRGPTGQGG